MLATITSPGEMQVMERMNRGAAALNREAFKGAGVFVASLFGGGGCGKTSLLQATLRRLRGEFRIGVIVGNIRADQDAERLEPLCDQLVAVEAMDLDAELVREALQRIALNQLDILFIERAAGSVPKRDDLGQTASVGLFSVCGGDDKLVRYANRIEHADLVLLTKSDLLPFMSFDASIFRQAVHALNPGTPVLQVSTRGTDDGLREWCAWLRKQVRTNPAARNAAPPLDLSADYFFG